MAETESHNFSEPAEIAARQTAADELLRGAFGLPEDEAVGPDEPMARQSSVWYPDIPLGRSDVEPGRSEVEPVRAIVGMVALGEWLYDSAGMFGRRLIQRLK